MWEAMLSTLKSLILRIAGQQVNFTTPQPLLRTALWLHGLGLCVIPMVALKKQPAVKWKPYQQQRPDEETLRQWFADCDNGNLGMAVVCGKVSGGLLIRDFDNPASYAAWKARHRHLAEVLVTVQAHRGPHVWFRCRDYLQSGERSFVRNLGDGELRGDGHVARVPPSVHASGHTYQWLNQPSGSIPFAALSDLDITHRPGNVAHVVSVLPPAAGCLPPTPRDHWETNGSNLQCSKTLDEVIERTLPRKHGERNRAIFQFARHLKGLDGYRDADPDVLEPVFRRWYEAALPFIGTKDFAWNFAEFCRAWSLIQTPAGVGSLSNALGRAKLSGVLPSAEKFRAPELRLLVSLCRELQIEQGDRPFFLSCRDAADAIGLTRRKKAKRPEVTAWRWLAMLCHTGVLQKIASGSRKDRKANEYRYREIPSASSLAPRRDV